MTGNPTGRRPDLTGSDRKARPVPTGFPYRGEPADGKPDGENGRRQRRERALEPDQYERCRNFFAHRGRART